MPATTPYPDWAYYPSWERPAEWAVQLMQVVAAARADIGSKDVSHLTSDKVLAFLRPGMEALGYQVESGKKRTEKIRRPVLFGERGTELVAYEVDAVHDELGVLVEVEAGRGARGNAVYRDIVRNSLIVDARFLALGVMSSYRHMTGARRPTSRATGRRRPSSTRSTPAAGCGCRSRDYCSSVTDRCSSASIAASYPSFSAAISSQ